LAGGPWNATSQTRSSAGSSSSRPSFRTATILLGDVSSICGSSGKQSNVETAKWAFNALIDAYDRLWVDYRRRTHAPASDRRAFVAGVSRGFTDKMSEERQTLQDEQDILRGTGGTALALLNVQQQTQEAFKAAYPKLGTSRTSFTGTRDSGGARQAGYAAGRALNLSRPIGQSRPKGFPS
jgi:hypothetical protein